MITFTRGLLFICLLACFYSCARRQQALYQPTPKEHVGNVLPTSADPIELILADTTQLADESLLASATTNPERYSNQTDLKREKREQNNTSLSTTKAINKPSGINQSRKQAYKLLVKQRLSDVAPPTSGLAIASLVCGILAFFVLAVVLGPLAVIFGGIALSKIRKNPEVKGRGLAVAGLVLGIVATVVIIVVLAAR